MSESGSYAHTYLTTEVRRCLYGTVTEFVRTGVGTLVAVEVDCDRDGDVDIEETGGTERWTCPCCGEEYEYEVTRP